MTLDFVKQSLTQLGDAVALGAIMHGTLKWPILDFCQNCRTELENVSYESLC